MNKGQLDICIQTFNIDLAKIHFGGVFCVRPDEGMDGIFPELQTGCHLAASCQVTKEFSKNIDST